MQFLLTLHGDSDNSFLSGDEKVRAHMEKRTSGDVLALEISNPNRVIELRLDELRMLVAALGAATNEATK